LGGYGWISLPERREAAKKRPPANTYERLANVQNGLSDLDLTLLSQTPNAIQLLTMPVTDRVYLSEAAGEPIRVYAFLGMTS
jgi:hypothetical protein